MSHGLSEKTLIALETVQRAWAEHGQWGLEVERKLAKELGVDRRTIRRYRTEVEKLIRCNLDPEAAEVRRAEIGAAAWSTYCRAGQKEQPGVQIRALELLAKLFGAFPADGAEMAGEGGRVHVTFTIPDRKPPPPAP